MEAKSAAMQESQRLNTNLLTARRAAEEQALTDALTGLPNRRAMDSSLSQIIREGVDFACMHLDLDKFKAVNDKFGHAAGDYILKNAGQILQEEIRSQDIVCRVGGDEFVLLFRGLTDPKKLEGIAKRIIKRFEMPIQFEGNICQISGSAGTTVSTFYNTLDPDEILRHADEALYASKNAGRGRHMFYAERLAIAR
jgi:diguanylate cyclase (GGDEF)-like protein